MSIKYEKPHLSLEEQIALLQDRGLLISDKPDAIKCLHRNGYYRLKAYWHPFRKIVDGKHSDDFLEESDFDNARRLYQFDKDFKLLMLDAIERVEIAVRAEIALRLSARNVFAHRNPAFFRPSFTRHDGCGETKHQRWLKKFDEAADRSVAEFVLHHKRKYGNRIVPIWIAIELWDFGLLSSFYSGMLTSDCIEVATTFAIPNWKMMGNWLHSLNYVRNVIAHHGRLWNLNLNVRPSLPKNHTMPMFDELSRDSNARVYSICCILCYFSQIINPKASWNHQLANHIRTFPVIPHVSVQDMGFPADWERHSFWN